MAPANRKLRNRNRAHTVARDGHLSLRYGLTLMELLVVIIIISLVTAATIPIMNPQAAPRRIREASRIVSGFINGARNRAISEGHPVGIILERQPGANNSACFKLFFAEQLVPYAGDTINARATVSGGSADFKTDANMSLIKVNDLVQFNYQGHIYQITGKTGTKCTLLSATSPLGKPPDMSQPALFQIFRQPTAAAASATNNGSLKSGEKPVQLPNGIAIDLSVSGMGDTGKFITGTEPIILMFNANGGLDKMYGAANASPIPATDTVHLLIGRNENIGQDNLDNLGNIWVSIGNQTGMVSTVENSADPAGTTKVQYARGYATSRESMGGR